MGRNCQNTGRLLADFHAGGMDTRNVDKWNAVHAASEDTELDDVCLP